MYILNERQSQQIKQYTKTAVFFYISTNIPESTE